MRSAYETWLELWWSGHPCGPFRPSFNLALWSIDKGVRWVALGGSNGRDGTSLQWRYENSERSEALRARSSLLGGWGRHVAFCPHCRRWLRRVSRLQGELTDTTERLSPGQPPRELTAGDFNLHRKGRRRCRPRVQPAILLDGSLTRYQ